MSLPELAAFVLGVVANVSADVEKPVEILELMKLVEVTVGKLVETVDVFVGFIVGIIEEAADKDFGMVFPNNVGASVVLGVANRLLPDVRSLLALVVAKENDVKAVLAETKFGVEETGFEDSELEDNMNCVFDSDTTEAGDF